VGGEMSYPQIIVNILFTTVKRKEHYLLYKLIFFSVYGNFKNKLIS